MMARGATRLAGDILADVDRKIFLERLFPGAAIVASGRDKFRVAGQSIGGLEVHRQRPVWHLHGDNIGGGLLQLVSYMLTGSKNEYRKAAEWVSENFTDGRVSAQQAAISPRTVKRQPHDRYQVLEHAEFLPPFDLSALKIKSGRVTQIWYWQDHKGRNMAMSVRIEQPDGKIVLPVSYAKVYDHVRKATDWRWWFTRPSTVPLYRLPSLLNSNRPVLLAEGEPAADAATKLFRGQFVASTVFGGGSSIASTDLSRVAGRTFILWPDCDPVQPRTGVRPGLEIMLRNAAWLEASGARVLMVGIEGGKWVPKASSSPYTLEVDETSGYFDVFPPKWDLDDPLPANITKEALFSMVNKARPLHGREWSELKKYHTGELKTRPLERPGL